ncbi:hypothetical protein HUJ04_003208 [Dendroctonus ponderosae]|nr:hypothetical protein HUJ04_003208 [Dendroctonus ponderosae]
MRKGVDNRYQGYLVDEVEIVHLYHVPHLFKGIRNGLLKADLHFVPDGVPKVASWDHLLQLYRIDSNMARFSLICKLTDEHLLANKLKKMSVKHCTQVSSRTVASAIKVRAEMGVDLTSLRLTI